ncbi:ribose-phosphate pyrophosphokinase [Ruminiclostridium hungatei]|uniref:Ribose-phosphate pyrophosphokinase n=1 Tax=Ruminiclostridium hungatei TaxID=48256 RepID=A0A1V4SR20_RUMHU|nr:ComF family protein [Ruminiclostridium hungatei]OPX45677.1 ribose-phosphate pyrophosphokinase [Ruminiclostridium hungatei]
MKLKLREARNQSGGIFISLLEYIFPPRCSICNEVLSPESPINICISCARDMEYFSNCVEPFYLPGEMKTYCDGIICVGKYCNALKNSIRRFKFKDKPSYYRAFGKLLALKVRNTVQAGEIDAVIPVPMHKGRMRQRGYNQAELMAGLVARELGLKLEGGLLIKVLETRSQSLLSRAERFSNLEGAFTVNCPSRAANKNILLVDDILTTGSTVNQCSKELKQAGAARIIAGVIATTRAD